MSGSNLVFLFGSCAFRMSYALSRYGQVVLGLSPLRFGLYNVVLRRSGPTVRTERSSDVTVRQVRS
ncbi:hypothetical protein [Streptomyces sp. F001]|uniref:hypothetical protein n=1 Tax=Streptomyces sp. F001 TaxID=1510026 RepID=UPI001F109B5D|nr:hypothetical protein [Streptomyces sp. F001]